MSSKNLKRAVALARDPQPLIVSPRLDRWLVDNPNMTLPEELAEEVKQLLMAEGRDRTQAWSASSAHKCLRSQQFSYFGIEQKRGYDSRLSSIFQDGTWRHMRLQMAMRMAGIIDSIEDFFHHKGLNCKGSTDGMGVVPDDMETPLGAPHPHAGEPFGLEIKGINGFQFDRVIVRENDMLPEHKHQVTRYVLMGAPKLWAVIYESKATGDWKEFVYTPTKKMLHDVKEELDGLNAMTKRGRLFPVLSECSEKKGDYKNCPYAYMCLEAGDRTPDVDPEEEPPRRPKALKVRKR